jgi:5-methylcytosine-specific restriction endonuclease McrA
MSEERRKLVKKAWYEKNKQKVIEQHKEYRAKNREKTNAYSSVYYQKTKEIHLEKRRTKNAQYREDNRDKELARLQKLNQKRYNDEKNRYNAYIKGNEKRKLEFTITLEEASVLFRGECHYCGIKSNDKINGIDRIDNEVGYIINNCVSACWTCNRMKGSMGYKDFIEHIKAMYSNFNKV